MKRRPLIAANWKMHGTTTEVQAYLEALVARVRPDGPEVVFCPPYPYLALATTLASGSQVAVGAQSCHWVNKGAFTGEVAAGMLVDLGVQWTVVGHSERRQYFAETDETAARRALAAQAAGIAVIFCLGESLEQRDAGETMAVLERQSSVLADLDPARLVVAYEPIWAIGTGRNATPEQAQEAHAFLRTRCADMLGAQAGGSVRILYGGSVKPDNAAELLGQADVDGALVGGASLDADAFWAIIQAAPAVGPDA